MQQQDWITATTSNEVDGGFLSFDLPTSETIKHRCIPISVSGWPRMKPVERPGIEPPSPTGVRMKLARLRGSVL
jgi:hypothetical protein